ncbi:MAG: hypothetical protein AB8G22_25445 [Saprospiraceae bacterium]
MDNIQFKSRLSTIEDYQVVDVIINGHNLIDYIRGMEAQWFPILGIKMPPGKYEGVPPLMSLPPKRHFWGFADACYQKEAGRVAVLENGQSGIPEEWTISVEIEVDGEKVIWRDFRQEHTGMVYEHLRDFQFDLVAYRNALKGEIARI